MKVWFGLCSQAECKGGWAFKPKLWSPDENTLVQWIFGTPSYKCLKTIILARSKCWEGCLHPPYGGL